MRPFYLLAIFFITFVLSSSAQASIWNWSFDTVSDGTVSGTLTTIETGYLSGNYTVSDPSFTVVDAGSTGLPVGLYSQSIGFSFNWNATTGISTPLESGLWFLVTAVDNDIFYSFSDKSIDYSIANGIPNEGNNFQISPVPIPAALWLFMSGLIGLVWKGRQARQSTA